MEIIHIASECAPFAKVGGLADVAAALPKAEAKLGHHVLLILPKYDTIQLDGLTCRKSSFSVEEGGRTIPVSVWEKSIEGVTLYLIDPEHPDAYYHRGSVYAGLDDHRRYLFLSKAAAKLISTFGLKPSVVHLHDWHAASATLFLPSEVKTVLTIHNVFYQGQCPKEIFDTFCSSYDEKVWQDPFDGELINLLKGGILTASQVTTVSPTYREEILTPEQGFGLSPFLSSVKDHFSGVLNGIDTDYWNPASDSFLPFSIQKENPIPGKELNKRAAQKRFDLEETGDPLVIAITRFVTQKGPDLIAYGLEKTLEMGGQFILLASSHDPESNELFQELKVRYHHNHSARILEGFDEGLAHILFGAADLILVPSIFEPCGLTQLIAMRYGTLPLVRKTGGLKDTVFDAKSGERQNGFSFLSPDNRGIGEAMEEAFTLYHTDRTKWNLLVKRGMEGDYGWETPAHKYLDLYTN